MDFIIEIDKLVQNTIATILETPLNEEHLIQCQLPLSHGGLGIMAAKSIVQAAQISKWKQVCDDVRCLTLGDRPYQSSKI